MININLESKTPINTTLNTYLHNRLNQLIDKRDIPMERIVDKTVDLLLDYMEDNENIIDQIKTNNNDAIQKNLEMIKKKQRVP